MELRREQWEKARDSLAPHKEALAWLRSRAGAFQSSTESLKTIRALPKDASDVPLPEDTDTPLWEREIQWSEDKIQKLYVANKVAMHGQVHPEVKSLQHDVLLCRILIEEHGARSEKALAEIRKDAAIQRARDVKRAEQKVAAITEELKYDHTKLREHPYFLPAIIDPSTGEDRLLSAIFQRKTIVNTKQWLDAAIAVAEFVAGGYGGEAQQPLEDIPDQGPIDADTAANIQ